MEARGDEKDTSLLLGVRLCTTFHPLDVGEQRQWIVCKHDVKLVCVIMNGNTDQTGKFEGLQRKTKSLAEEIII